MIFVSMQQPSNIEYFMPESNYAIAGNTIGGRRDHMRNNDFDTAKVFLIRGRRPACQ